MENMVEIRPFRTLNIDIYENPNSKATIFMIHGMGGYGGQWREQIAALKDQYTLIVPDLLGHGNSQKPKPDDTNPYAFMQHIQDLDSMFRKYAGAKNILMGHSYGGALVTFLAAMQLQKVQKMILISPIACEAKTEIPRVYKLPLFILNWFRPTLEKEFCAAAFDSSVSLDVLAKEKLYGKSNSLMVMKYMMRGMENIPFLETGQINIPTLIILGKTDKIISLAKTTIFYANLPLRTLTIVEHAAHMVMLEQPEQTNTLIKDFLANNVISDPK